MSSRARFGSKNCAGKAGMSSAAVSTCGQELSGLCELCDKEAAEIECASCGPVRVNSNGALTCTVHYNFAILHFADGGPLLLCEECCSGLHSKGVFTHHKLVKISRKVCLVIEMLLIVIYCILFSCGCQWRRSLTY